MADLELLTLILALMTIESTEHQDSTNPPLLIASVSTRFLLPNDYCKKNGYHSKTGKLCFSKSSMEYFAENYCKTDWQTVDKIRLKNRMIELSNGFDNYDKGGLPIFRTSEKAQLVDLYPNGC